MRVRIWTVLAAAVMLSGCGGSSSTSPSAASTETRIIGLSGNLAFGSVQVGSQATTTLTITNSGNSPLTVTGMTGPSGYSASWTNGTISGGGTQLVTIAFAPTAATTYNGTLIVNGNQTSGTNSAPISGSGALARANIQAVGSGTYVCFTGLCTQFTYVISNVGPGCATNVQVTTRFYGADGAGPQLGIDVPMGATSGTLSSFLFRVGSSTTVQNLVFFNDIRSAHTVFKPTITWSDTPCS
jgi:hypothetical protein